MEIIGYLWQYIVQTAGLVIAYVAAIIFIYLALRRLRSQKMTILLVIVFVGVSLAFYVPNGAPKTLGYPLGLKTFGPADGPVLPFSNIWNFITHFGDFERVESIARDPNEIPNGVTTDPDGIARVTITAQEVIGEMDDDITFNYWTFDGDVPGPFLRVREGDMVELTFRNDPNNIHHHSIDLHAVTGPGGGASVTEVAPGEEKKLTFTALNPGLYVYHCAHPNAANHMAHGMYGLILVEPEDGLADVDHEFYVMQGEFYSAGKLGRKGLQLFDTQAMLLNDPQYIVFNGKVGSLVDTMKARVGDTVRMYVGNGAVNRPSNFHIIGEIFDRVYREGDLVSDPAQSVQTTLIPAGGATVVEFTVEYPGVYKLVDHALAHVERGAWGTLEVTGSADPTIFNGTAGDGHNHTH